VDDLLDQAIKDTVFNYKFGDSRGATALAPLVNMNAGTLSNKANPAMEQQLNLREAVSIMRTSGDFRILSAMAQLVRHACVPLPQPAAAVSDMALLEAYTQLHENIGRHATSFHKAIADRHLSAPEYSQISTDMYRVIQSGLGLLSRLEQIIDR